MNVFPVHLRLFVAFLFCFSLVLIPVTWTLVRHSEPVTESEWAQDLAWTVAQMARKAAKVPPEERKASLLDQAHLVHGQMRWISAKEELLLVTQERASANRPFPPWPQASDFAAWNAEHPSGAKNTRWKNLKPGVVAVYGFPVNGGQPEQVVFKVHLALDASQPANLFLRFHVPKKLLAPWQAGIRIGLAIATSLAVLLTLLWNLAWGVPLRKLDVYLAQLREGDLGTAMPSGLYGLKGLGEAVAELTFGLRQRVAKAHEPIGVLEQFMEALPLAVVVWNSDRSLLAANGLARRLMGFQHPENKDQMDHLLRRAEMKELVNQAEEEASPVKASFYLQEPFEKQIEGVFHVLKRPQEKAYVTFVSADFLAHPPRFLASDDRAEPVKFYKLWRRASRMSQPLLKRTKNEIVYQEKLPEELVAEVQGRLYWALTIVLVTCAATLREQSIQVDAQVKRNAIGVTFGVSLDAQVSQLLKIILSPLGGNVSIEDGEVVLWLPRA